MAKSTALLVCCTLIVFMCLPIPLLADKASEDYKGGKCKWRLPFVGCILCGPAAVAPVLRGGLVSGSEELLPQGTLLWCVARASVSDLTLQETMEWACNNGADCEAIRPGARPCFIPDNLYEHASYAVNDYWQCMCSNGGTCDFNGVATLVSKDPSNGHCNYMPS